MRLAYVTEEMFAKTRTNREYAEGFVEYLKEIDSVEVACLLREVADGKYKVSMRSKDDVDVAAVARTLRRRRPPQRRRGAPWKATSTTVKNILIGAFSL